MATRKQVIARATELGATVEFNDRSDYGVFAKPGTRFAGMGIHMVIVYWNPSWRTADIYDALLEDMEMGVETCEEEHCDYCTDA